MSDDVATYVRVCDACQRHKRRKQPDKAPLEKLPVPQAPLSRIQIDFVELFQPSIPDKYRCVLPIQDTLTTYSLLIPTVDCTAHTAAQVLLQHWVTVFDVPEAIQSDQGPHFTGEVFRKIRSLLGIHQALCTPNHAQLNGQVERQNQLYTTSGVYVANSRLLGQKRSWQYSMHTIHPPMPRPGYRLINFCFIRNLIAQSALQYQLGITNCRLER